MKERQKLKKIEDYLKGQMTAKERQQFALLIETDPQWQEWLQQYSLSIEALEHQVEKELRQDLENWSEKSQKDQTRRKGRSRISKIFRLTAVAATLLIGGLLSYWYADTNFSNRALAEKYYQQPLNPAVRLPGGVSSDDPLQLGIDAYSNEEWSQAIKYLSEVDPSSDQYLAGQYFLGHAFYKVEDFPQAMVAFQKVMASESLYREASEWMNVLALLQMEPTKSEILSLLNAMEQSQDHPYREIATELKAELKSFWRIL